MATYRNKGEALPKDPDSIEPDGVDWTDVLASISTSETISTSTWSVSPSGLTLSNDSIISGSKKTQVTYSSGTAGVRYTVKNRITTSSGYRFDCSIIVTVGDT